MTARSGPASTSPFLAFVLPQDRSPLRFGVWLALGVPAALLGLALVGSLAKVFDPALVTRLESNATLSGPHRLVAECAFLGLVATAELAAALALVAAARLAFQRPAWTFTAPVRLFTPRLLLLGVLVYGLLALAGVGLDLLQGGRVSPPILDPAQPWPDRTVYALASLPLILVAAAAEEILFRGVLLQVAGAFLKTRIGLCVLNGLLFGLMHAEPSPIDCLGLTLMGAVFAYSVLELGGLEFSLGAHFANNAVILLFEAPLSSAEHNAPFHWSDLARADAWESLAYAAVSAALAFAAVRLISRRRRRS